MSGGREGVMSRTFELLGPLSISGERLELETSNLVRQCKMLVPLTINRSNRNRKYNSNMEDVRFLKSEVG